MKARAKFALGLSIICLVTAGWMWTNADSTVQGHSPQPDTSQPNRQPLADLNDKARAAENGDETAVRAVAEEVFTAAAVSDAPVGMTDAIKDRLVRAELKYRRGERDGVPEINVHRVINGLATKFKAPEYAKTSGYEIRKLRMQLLPFLPNLVGKERTHERKQKKVGDAINTDMSPLEAAYITVTLLHQKMNNEEYQLTNSELKERWAEKHGDKNKQDKKPGKSPSLAHRKAEMEQITRQSADAISERDLLNIPNRTLDILGIEP